MSATINGSVTLDESPGLQTSGVGVAVAGEGNNDNDVSISVLQSQASSFYDRLFADTQLALDSSFAVQSGVARSADNFITSGTGSTSLGFSTESGQVLSVYGGTQPGAPSGLSALTGGAITLFADPVLGDRMVLGVDGEGDVAFAIFMDPSAGLTSAKVWMVQFEALLNPDATNPDDPVSLMGLGVASGSSTEFNFNALPSGQSLFGTVGDASTGLLVIGKTPVLNADGTFTNTSNTINTSQGGGPTTIGVDNQMFDAGEGAYFTFVKNPDPRYLAGAVGGLDQNEADDADNIQYTGGTLEVNSGFVKISQIQGNSLATMSVTAYDMDGAPQGQAFAKTGLGTGTAVPITAVRVYDAAGVLVEDTALGGDQDPSVVITITNGVATVSGVNANYQIEWDTAAVHDQVLIQAVAGKFDIGGFGTKQNAPTADQRLDFVARVVDGDGDSSTSGFSIGIDGTGIFDDGIVTLSTSSSSSSLFGSEPIDELAVLLA